MDKNSHSDTTRMSIDVSRNLHKIIKVHAAMHDQGIREFVIDAISEKLEREQKLNKTTRDTLSKTDAGLELTKHKDLKSLFAKLGI